MRKQQISIILLIILMLVITSLSYSYYIQENDYFLNLNTDAYEVYTELSFNGVVHDELSSFYDNHKHAYVINLFDETAENYIGNLSLDIYVSVPVASKLRFILNESYELTRYYHNQEQTVITEIIYQETIDEMHHAYSLLKKGSYNQTLDHTDSYTYAYETFVPNQTYHLNIISSGTSYPAKENSLYSESCYLYLDYRFEFVQANRFSQVWKVDPLLLS